MQDLAVRAVQRWAGVDGEGTQPGPPSALLAFHGHHHPGQLPRPDLRRCGRLPSGLYTFPSMSSGLTLLNDPGLIARCFPRASFASMYSFAGGTCDQEIEASLQLYYYWMRRISCAGMAFWVGAYLDQPSCRKDTEKPPVVCAAAATGAHRKASPALPPAYPVSSCRSIAMNLDCNHWH